MTPWMEVIIIACVCLTFIVAIGGMLFVIDRREQRDREERRANQPQPK